MFNSGRGFLCRIVLAALFLAFIGCSSESTEDKGAGRKSAEERARRCVEEGIDCPETVTPQAPPCTVASATSRDFTLTVLLPYLHSVDRGGRLQAQFEIARNLWAEHGVDVWINEAWISQEAGNLWTRRITPQVRQWISLEGVPANTTGMADRLITTGRPRDYLDQGEMPWEEVRRIWRLDQRVDERKGETIDEFSFESWPCACYFATIDFTIVAPDDAGMAALDKNARFDLTSLAFGFSEVVFDDGQRPYDLTSKATRPAAAVELHIARKPGGGYHGIAVKGYWHGSDLIDDFSCE